MVEIRTFEHLSSGMYSLEVFLLESERKNLRIDYLRKNFEAID